MDLQPADLPDLEEYTDMLLACPFCGQREAELAEFSFTEADAREEGWAQTTFWSVVCTCGAVDYPGHDSPLAAVAMWNMRNAAVLHG